MTAAPKLPPLMTVDDFLAWPGDGTATRYELVDGGLRAMAPTTNAHGIIQSNLIFAITGHLRARQMPCIVVTAPGIRPLIRADWNFRIPDLGVTCAPDRKGERHLPDPILLIEVLSPSNDADTYENIRAYATLPTIVELVVIHAEQMTVELLRRQPDQVWPANPTMIEASGFLSLASLDLVLPLSDVYAGTHLVGS
jgi:Uma2 family endonuclease